MWLIVSILVGSLVAALLLAYILKAGINDRDVWEELGDSNTRTSVSNSILPLHSAREAPRATSHSQPSRVQTMTTLPPIPPPASRREVELRRSSRIEQRVPLVVLGTNRRGETFRESTSALSLNLHGCRYPSRHDYAPEGWVTLQVTGTDGADSPAIRARVCSVVSPQSPYGFAQVGVELETPGNVWGIPAPPADWERVLDQKNSAAVLPAMAMPSVKEPPSVPPAVVEMRRAPSEHRAEVTVFPGPAAPPPAETVAPAEPSAAKPERVVLTAEKLLHALQGKLQQAAEHAVQSAIAARLDEATRSALMKIDDAWKANLRQTEEFSAARLAEVQHRWEREIVVYRSRAEDIARRLEALGVNTQQYLVDSQEFLGRIKKEIEPGLQTRLNQSFARANNELETKAAQLSAQHLARLSEASEAAEPGIRSRLDKTIAEVRSLLDSAPASVSDERVESLVNSSREYTLNRMEERLNELWRQFEQQQDLARQRTDQVSQLLEKVSGELRQAQAQQDQAIAEVRSLLTSANTGISPEQLDSRLNSVREQSHDLLEWRLGEVSAQFQRLHDASLQHSDEIARRLDSFSADARSHLDEGRKLAEHVQQQLAKLDPAVVEQSIEHAAREFETAAARISDRQLVRLLEQKQVLAREIALELDARASESRASVQKSANATLEDFRHRIEVQIDLIIAEATERIVSTISALDAENRAACDTRRRAMESDVARAAEQSTAEFRTSIKAFLYSCLVAAVSAVDEHAQNTMASLGKDPDSLTLDAHVPAPLPPENRASAAAASSSGTSQET